MIEESYGSEFWDKINNEIKKHYYHGIMADYKKYAYLRLLEKWDLNLKGKKILVTDLFDEAHCSNNLFYACNRFSNTVAGIDISLVAAKNTKKRIKQGGVVVGDIKNTPLKSGSFDLILSPSTIDHFPEQGLVCALNEMERLLNEKGKIVISVHNRFNVFLHFYITKIIKKPKYRLDTYSVKSFKKIIKKTNLITEKQSAICHLPAPIILRYIFNKISKIKKTRFILIKLYKFFETLETTKIKNCTAELLVFELAKKPNYQK